MHIKTPESTHAIRFPDCDPFNHLNNSRYIDYFINAREDHVLNNYDFDIYRYAQKTGKSWVVAQNQIAYFAPALLMEKVVIQTRMLEWDQSDILVEMRMFDEQKTKLKALLWTTFVHYDLVNLKRLDHDDSITGMFKQYEYPLEEKVTFEQRITDIKTK
jgi:YbgC/YbaW family acyl-CoA thioester hydrolase